MEKLLVGEKVEWKTLGEVCEFKNGFAFKSNLFSEKGIPIIRITNIANGKIIFDDLKYFKLENYEIDLLSYKVFPNDILIAMSGATTGKIGYNYTSNIGYLNQRVGKFIPNYKFLNNRFLYHFLLSQENIIYNLANGTGAQPNLSTSQIKSLEIPIPSLETQEKIVKILDNFTKYFTELQAELQARNKQYNYYRDMLLSEDYLNKISEKLESQIKYEISCIELEKIIKIKNGKDWKSLEKGNIPVYGSGGKMGVFVDKYSYNKPTVLIPRKGSIENIFYLEKPFWNVDTIFYTEINEEKILPKYFYYFMQNYNIKSLSTDSTRPSITQSTLNKLKILLPPIEIQNKIVKILDRFQELLSDTKGLLPLEIEQRRKQYEYYREKLLTFDEGEGYALSTAQHSTATSKFFELLKKAAKIAGVGVSDKVEWKTLREIAVGNLTYGSGASAIEYDGEVRYVRITDIDTNGNLKEEKFSPSEIEEKYFLNYGDILFARSGATVGKNYIHQSGENSVYAGYLIRLIVNQKLALPKYIYHCINTTEYFKFVENTKSNGSQPNINAKQYSDFKILLPPLPVQEYIVSILDKFDALVNDLSQGLPREIELRQKQYEYYREKLLNFEK